MLRAFKKIFVPQPYQQEAHQLYVTLVEQARAPVFYTDYQVPDTLDGRFDMVVLHVVLLCQRLKLYQNDTANELIRALTETFFADMDRNLREMGSTDTGVGKRIKNMSKAYFGRLKAFDEALGDDKAVGDALKRNLYRSTAVTDDSLNAMVAYVRMRCEQFAALALETVAAGKLSH